MRSPFEKITLKLSRKMNTSTTTSLVDENNGLPLSSKASRWARMSPWKSAVLSVQYPAKSLILSQPSSLEQLAVTKLTTVSSSLCESRKLRRTPAGSAILRLLWCAMISLDGSVDVMVVKCYLIDCSCNNKLGQKHAHVWEPCTEMKRILVRRSVGFYMSKGNRPDLRMAVPHPVMAQQAGQQGE